MALSVKTRNAMEEGFSSAAAANELADAVDAHTLELAGAITGTSVAVTGAFTADSGATTSLVTITASTPVDTTGTNVQNFIRIVPTIGNASGGTNSVRGIQIENITGDAQVTETAINVGTGWDSGIACASPVTFTSTLAVTGAITPTGGVAAAAASSAGPAGMIHTGGAPATAATDGTELTPTTTTVYTVEIFVPCNMTITGVRVFNGAAVDGNITVALYTAAGVAIAAAVSAATAGSGTDAYQSIPFATPYAATGPAKYLIGFQYSNGAHRPNCHVVGTAFGIAQASATIGVTTISPLPTAFVTATQPIASLY